VSARSSRIFGILGLATAILMVMFEIDNYRRTGQVAYFWVLVAVFMGALGLSGIVFKPPPK
jgi:phosphate/sulfate permease